MFVSLSQCKLNGGLCKGSITTNWQIFVVLCGILNYPLAGLYDKE